MCRVHICTVITPPVNYTACHAATATALSNLFEGYCMFMCIYTCVNVHMISTALTLRVHVYISADEYLREGVSLWWLQDTRFKIPRVNMHCSIESVGAEASPPWMGMCAWY